MSGLATIQELGVEACSTAVGRSRKFDKKTAPAMKPTNAGKINVNVQPCTLPVVGQFDSSTQSTAASGEHLVRTVAVV
jgi:hypothetical protein